MNRSILVLAASSFVWLTTLTPVAAQEVEPASQPPPEEFVVADQKLFSHMLEVDNLLKELVAYTQIAGNFGIDVSYVTEELAKELSDVAANRSILLELSIGEVAMLFRLLLAIFILFLFVQLAKLVHKGMDKGLRSGRFTLSHLLYRPFDVGDVVDAGGVSGRVSHMSLVNTTINTLDNQKLIVPNNIIWQSVITNVTAQRKRRIDLVFGISYGDDIEKAERVLNEVVAAEENVLDDPEPVIRVHELGESSVNFVVRPWVKTGDYWDTYGALTKAVKIAFDKEGISIPFPQRDVHVIEQK